MTKPYILIIEDDEAIKNHIEDTAYSLGCTCDWASNLEDAVCLVETKDHSMALLDLEIPIRPRRTASIEYGCNCLEQIRKIKDKRTLPIVVMTAHTKRGLDLASRLMQNGANDFVPKPFDSSDRSLSQVIRDNMPNMQKQRELEKFQGGELVIFPDQVTLAGISILGRRAMNSEIQMLKILAEKTTNGTYRKFFGREIAKKCGVANGKVSDWARVIREAAVDKLKEHNIDCGRGDVLAEDRTHGYYFKEWISVTIEDHVEAKAQEETPPESPQAARKRWICEELIEMEREWTLTEMAKHLKFSTKTIRRDIKILADQGLIERIGKGTWRKKKR